MPASIVISNYTGGLGNRLLLQAHALAFSQEFKCRLFNLALLPASHCLNGFYRNPLGEFPARLLPFDTRLLVRPIRGILEKWILFRINSRRAEGEGWIIVERSKIRSVNMVEADFKKNIFEKKWLFLWGWLFRAYPLLKKHAPLIRSQLSIRPEAAPHLQPFFGALREKNEKLVCVHVRQGDARNVPASEGLYIPAEDLAQAYRANLARFGKHRLIVCSDEPVPPDLFPKQALASPLRTLEEDLVLMSKSQWILGGRSTLSRFAAFVGGASYLDCSGVSSKEPRLLPSLETLDDVG